MREDNMLVIYALLVVMTGLGATAGFFFKKTSDAKGKTSGGSQGIRALAKNTNLHIGGALYVIAAVLNIHVLKFLDYSVVLPLTSLTYVWTMMLSYFLLKEKVGKRKIVGVCLIFGGALILAY